MEFSMKGGGNLDFSELKSRLSHDDLLKVIEDVSQPYVLQVQTLISITNQSPSTMMLWRRSADSPNIKYTNKAYCGQLQGHG